ALRHARFPGREPSRAAERSTPSSSTTRSSSGFRAIHVPNTRTEHFPCTISEPPYSLFIVGQTLAQGTTFLGAKRSAGARTGGMRQERHRHEPKWHRVDRLPRRTTSARAGLGTAVCWSA